VTVVASFVEYDGAGEDEVGEVEVDEHELTDPTRTTTTPINKTARNLLSMTYFLELAGS